MPFTSRNWVLSGRPGPTGGIGDAGSGVSSIRNRHGWPLIGSSRTFSIVKV